MDCFLRVFCPLGSALWAIITYLTHIRKHFVNKEKRHNPAIAFCAYSVYNGRGELDLFYHGQQSEEDCYEFLMF